MYIGGYQQEWISWSENFCIPSQYSLLISCDLQTTHSLDMKSTLSVQIYVWPNETTYDCI